MLCIITDLSPPFTCRMDRGPPTHDPMRATLLSIIFGVAFTLCLTGRAAAGVVITGRIADENGLAIAFAKIELRSAPSAPALAATSDVAGGFSFQIEMPGDYLIHAERP